MAGAQAFGIEAFALDDRLRLFNFATADKRIEYLWVLRAFDRARANYVVLLHATEVATQLTELAADHPDAPAIDGDLTPLLDQLYGWQVLDRSYDGARLYGVDPATMREAVNIIASENLADTNWGCPKSTH